MAAGSVEISVTPEIAKYHTAQEIRITLTVRDIDGNVATPGNLSLRIRRPDDTEVVYTLGLGQLLLISTGVYYYDLLIDLSYDWVFRAEASGGIEAAYEKKLYTEGSVFAVSVPMPVPGSGHEGEIARVTGGVYQPYAGTPGQVLGWVAGVGWTSVTVAGLPGAAAPPVGSLQWNNAGAFDGTTSIQVGPLAASLRFHNPALFSDPVVASSSFLIGAYAGAQFLGGRNVANTGDAELMTWCTYGTDIIGIGDATYTGGTVIQGKPGSTFTVNSGGVTQFSVSPSAVRIPNWNLTFGLSSFATNGLIRAPYGNTLLSSRNAANTNNIDVVTVGGSSADSIDFDINSQSSTYVFNTKTGGSYVYKVNGTTEYTVDATAITMNANNVVGAGFYSGTGTVATTGLLRGAHGGTIVGVIANDGVTNIGAMTWGTEGTNIFGYGSNSATVAIYYRANVEHRWHIAGTQRLSLAASALAVSGYNVTLDTGALIFGANPAASGLVRVPHNNNALVGRNSAGGGDVVLVNWGATADLLQIGSTGVANTRLDIATGGAYAFRINSADKLTLDSAKMFLANTSAAPGDPTGGGHVYEEAGALKHRGSSSTITTLAAA